MSKLVHVAVAVIFNSENQVLIALRNKNQHQGGLWEFPGGKVEEGETVVKALHRELFEEVNLKVLNCKSLLQIKHDYLDKKVLLDVWLIDKHSGSANGNEGQVIKWVNISALANFEFPKANEKIITLLLEGINN